LRGLRGSLKDKIPGRLYIYKRPAKYKQYLILKKVEKRPETPKNRYKKKQHFANLESEDLKHKV
jgi:hypothetical protein